MALLTRTIGSSGPALALALLLAACGGGGADNAAPGSGGTGGTAGASASSIEFDPATTLMLVPGESRELTVRASPPAVYLVRFALLGDSQDASLDKSEISTDVHGEANVVVTAPGAATTFSLSAAIGDGVATTLGVSVSASGFGTLQVQPSYTGKREVPYWTASVRTGTDCASLAGNLLEDGDLVGTAPVGQVPQIDGVPVGPPLAVTLRGAFSVVGCQDVNDARADEIVAVTVPLTNLPMKLDQTSLEVSLGLYDPSTDFAASFDVEQSLGALGNGSNDGVALLDAMQLASGDVMAQAAFQSARKMGGWDLAIGPVIGGPTGIRDWAKPWLAQGLGTLPSEQSFVGHLEASESAGTAWLTLNSVGGAPARVIGLGPANIASWSAEADDSVLLGTTFWFLPSRLATGLALAPAKAAAPGAASVPDALAELLSCPDVAGALVSAGSGPGEAFSGCDASCAEKLCIAGLHALWQSAADASALPGGTTAKLVITATAAAAVDDHAQPFSFSGKWVGTLDIGAKTLPVGGGASGAKPPPPS